RNPLTRMPEVQVRMRREAGLRWRQTIVREADWGPDRCSRSVAEGLAIYSGRLCRAAGRRSDLHDETPATCRGCGIYGRIAGRRYRVSISISITSYSSYRAKPC